MVEKFLGQTSYQHNKPSKIGVVMVNLGTPQAPTAKALRTYLGEFLSDSRVIEIPAILWKIILHGIILRVRPAKSAQAYARVWAEGGSPLMVGSQGLVDKLNQKSQQNNNYIIFKLAMRYGQPAIDDVLKQLQQQEGVQKFMIVPLYPQYSGATTGSVADAVFASLGQWRWVPELRMLGAYHDDNQFIKILADSVRQHWQKTSKPQRLLISFHGMPKATLEKGDPYFCHCHKTARLLAQELNLETEQWEMVFQSRFGKAEWLKPYAAERLVKLPGEGITDIQVICPGFAVDCLETLDEIAIEGREEFLTAGGKRFDYIPALNTEEAHVSYHINRVIKNISGWQEVENSPEDLNEATELSQKLAIERGAKA